MGQEIEISPRDLRFEKLADIHLELDRIEQAHSVGQLTAIGSWSPGQILGHLAYWVNGAYHGFPIKTPLLVRLLLRPLKRRAIFGKMRSGIRIPGVSGGTLGTDPLPFEEGMQKYREALNRMRVQPPVLPSPAFGELSHPEWIALTCRHAELHLGSLLIKERAANEARPASA